MMRQYLSIKKENQDYVLFFRLGDFYEMFYDDALEISQFLEITLTARGQKDNKIPMCGIPYHAADNYLARLIKGGYKIAICEQVEDPAEAQGIVKREVVRYYTPGTILSEAMLEGKSSNYLAAVVCGKTQFGLSFVDLSTGEYQTTEFANQADLLGELERLNPAELLYQEGTTLPVAVTDWVERSKALLSSFDDWAFSLSTSVQTLQQFFQTQSLDGFGLRTLPTAVQAAGAILNYLKQMHGEQLSHIHQLKRYVVDEFMLLDVATQRNLELMEPLSGFDKRGTLLSVLDRTVTASGGRLLRGWMLRPLRDQQSILGRLAAVEAFTKQTSTRDSVRQLLKDMHDMERIMGRIDTGVGNAKDMVALGVTLQQVPLLQELLTPLETELCVQLKTHLDSLPDLKNLIIHALKEDPPFSIREGGFMNDGYSEELDELRAIKKDGKQWLMKLQEDERSKTGIKTLKVKYNKVFGYYLEVSKGQAGSVPNSYIRKQTLVNAERFITPELKEKEALILGADDRIHKLEVHLFKALREKIMPYTEAVQKMAQALATWDVLQSLAEVAVRDGYCKPEINGGEDLVIKDGRHPVVEHLLIGSGFVPNATELSCDKNQLMIITGPNMAGKSTYIRQVALISFMAQIGSFVPAKEAQLGIMDRIFTRVGAADELARGQSTFMLEMNETANILNNATRKSLVILDEVGRGTSTFDGVSIAWAIAEYIHEVVQAKTIFATHYHELTALANQYERIVNYNVACQESADDVVFLHTIVPGGTNKTYGIHVARLAGVPQSIILRSQEILKKLEATKRQEILIADHVPTAQDELALPFEEASSTDPVKEEVLEKLRSVDCKSLRPIEALLILDELSQKLIQRVPLSYIFIGFCVQNLVQWLL
jgi:DNA mismatch repair protein MutS